MEFMDAKLPGEKKNKKKKKPTLRFELDLPESTDTSCPEYSYIGLVRETLKEKKSKGENDIMCQDLLEEEEEKERNEAEAIAQYYEIKYGATAAGQKRKRKDNARDLVGAGYGYDDNDPFVDDSEAYDEIVPATLTTQHGSFYINTGKLNFRVVSDQSDTETTSSDDSIPLSHHAAKKKKRTHSNLLDSDESSIEFQTEDGLTKKKKKKKLKPPKDHEKKKKRKISINGKDKVHGLKQGSKKMKKPTSLAQKLVAKAKAQQMMNASSVGSPAHAGGAAPQYRKSSSEDVSVFRSKHELGHLENKDLAQMAKQVTKELMSVGPNKTSPGSVQRIKNGLDTPDLSKNTTSAENHELPPNLPQMLGDKIESLKKIAKSTEGEGKMKFFSSDVNRILLGIEESSQGLRNKERQGMYQHIAQHLPCSKETLLKRVKKLQVNDSDQQLKGPIERLKAAVDAVMTSQIEAYVLECDTKSEKFGEKACAASTDEDEECEEKSTPVPTEAGDGTAEKAKRTYAPRRKFKWDDNLRKLLCDVVTVKMNLYERFKFREKQNPEEYLKSFLETTIKPLWPKPWMQTRILFKESRSAHHHLTFNCQKQKKAGSNKKVPSVSKDQKISDGSSAHKTDAKLLPSHSSAGQNESGSKTSKKLTYETHDSKYVKPTYGAVKSNSRVIDLTSGGIELFASIESENSPTTSTGPKSNGTSRMTEKTSNSWKNENGAKHKNVMKVPLSLAPSGASKSDKKTILDTKAKIPHGASSRGQNIPGPLNSKMVQEYASDFVKMMMSPGQLSQPEYTGMPGLTNYEAISKILGLKLDDVIPKTVSKSQSDDKFQFKITSNPPVVSPNMDRPSPKGGFPSIDPSRKRIALEAPWTGQKKGIPRILTDQERMNASKQKGYSSMPTTPVGSMPTFNEVIPSKLLSAQKNPIISPNFVIPSPESSKFITQRQRGAQHPQDRKNTVSPNPPKSKILQTSPDATAKVPKLSSSPATLSLQRHQYHQSGTSSPQCSLSQVGSAHSGLPSILLSPMSSQYPPIGAGNSFAAAFTTPQGSPYSSTSKFKPPPSSPVHNYANTSMSSTGSPFTGSPFSNYPHVKIVDIQGNKDPMKQTNMNIQGNHSR